MTHWRSFPHIVATQQFDRPWLETALFPEAKNMARAQEQGTLPQSLRGKILVSLFFAESTRTRFSFEIAMLRLGGQYIATENAQQFSSAAKNESLRHTIQMLDAAYGCDVIVLRHADEGSAQVAVDASTRAAIINGGDGPGQHPTQALLDLFTIQEECGQIDNLRIALVGDLLRGRTVRSLAYLLSKFRGIKIDLVSPPSLRMKEDILAHLREHDVSFAHHTDLRKVAPLVDVVYQTRTQTNLGSVASDPEDQDSFCKVGPEVMGLLRSHARVLHPLPINQREKEIDPAVEEDPRVAHIRQARNGLYIRMALLKMILV